MRYTYLIPHMATANLIYTNSFSLFPFLLCYVCFGSILAGGQRRKALLQWHIGFSYPVVRWLVLQGDRRRCRRPRLPPCSSGGT